MKFYIKLMLIVAISTFCVGCDQATKALASNYLPKFYMDSYLNDIFRVGYFENTGAFLSLGSSLSSEYRFYIFVVAIAIFLSALLIYVACSKSLNTAQVVALTLFLSGGASNLYDRIVNNGAVIDFLNFGVGSLRTGVFNVADIAIVAGGVMFVFANSKLDLRNGNF
ncbi:signal peptidase II [Vibrio sp. 10N]|uniref:signal peptidase II n=1 Tax=Vibrio sp. 10N TaxID=3058938 RepID=UPI0028146B61|nr:signal peptidase II [Vibrio sp. 10N]GMQ46713.1 signal peptidase II [Vibrio sp. 10N]